MGSSEIFTIPSVLSNAIPCITTLSAAIILILGCTPSSPAAAFFCAKHLFPPNSLSMVSKERLGMRNCSSKSVWL